MHTPDEFTSILQDVRVLYNSGQYNLAFRLVQSRLTEYPAWAELYWIRGRLIQLIDDTDAPDLLSIPLDAAKHSFEMARSLSPKQVGPLIELGYFEYALNKNSQAALEHFEAAHELAESQLKDAIVGLAKCYKDLGREGLANEALARAELLFPDEGPMLELEVET